MSSTAQSTLSDLIAWTPSANSGATLQTMGQSALQGLIASANATSGDQYVFGGINSSVAPMADYDSTPTSAAKTAVDNAFQAAFGVLPTDPATASITPAQMQAFLSGPFAALFSGTNWSSDWSSASSTNTSADDRAGADGRDLDQREPASVPGSCASLYDALRIRWFSTQRKRAAGCRLGCNVARHPRPDFVDRHRRQTLGATQSAVTDANNSANARAHPSAKSSRQSRQRRPERDRGEDQQPDQLRSRWPTS